MATTSPPRRGKYDRTKTSTQRHREALERILEATWQATPAHVSPVPSVTEIVSLAGVGRNTFYAIFRSGAHAARAARQRVEAELSRTLDQAMASANTPIEQLRALARGWMKWAVTREPARITATMSSGATVLDARLEAVAHDLHHHGIAAAAPPPRRLQLLAAAWSDAPRQLRSEDEAEPIAMELVELTLRALR
jgi:AcrR family transcriptional regulator